MKHDGYKEPKDLYRERKRDNTIPLVVGGFFVLFLIVVSRQFLMQVRSEDDHTIAKDIGMLQGLFNTINESSKIIAIRSQKSPINFLNVQSFAGSFVGPLKVAYPENWKGPFRTEPLEFQGKEYEIVCTKKGFYIVPGEGVVLANGKVIGETLKFTEESDIDAMIADPAQLLSQSYPLAVKIPIAEQLTKQTKIEDTFPHDDDELASY
ncbi:hypothetical protein H0X06_05355 [Candidatus Dependentiae bacterium]|nr:hypothetical protein [Candidatus Dependentiae bacterium]